jgi:hypothetical protein
MVEADTSLAALSRAVLVAKLAPLVLVLVLVLVLPDFA